MRMLDISMHGVDAVVVTLGTMFCNDMEHANELLERR